MLASLAKSLKLAVFSMGRSEYIKHILKVVDPNLLFSQVLTRDDAIRINTSKTSLKMKDLRLVN